MGLIGHWRRSVLGAGGVALLLPLGLTLGIALTTALGGGTTLRALGQVFAGPGAVTGPAGEGLEAAARLPAVPVRARVSRAGAPAVFPTPIPASDGAPGPADPAPAGPDRDSVPPSPSGPPEPSQPTPSPAPGPGPAPGSGSPGGEAGGATDLLPAPVGDAVDTVVDLIPVP